MLFTETNLKNFRMTRKYNFIRMKDNRFHHYHYACNKCGYPFLHTMKNGKFCSYNCANDGENNPMYGRTGELSPMFEKIPTKETIEKISKALKGKYTKEKHSHFGKKFPEHSIRMSGENNPTKRPEVREKMRLNSPRISGINHHNWKGGISCEPYCIQWSDKEYKNWIKYERDGGKCQNPQCNHKTTRLCLHHINYNKKDCRPVNLITLCISCNTGANKDREWHEAWYSLLMVKLYYKVFRF